MKNCPIVPREVTQAKLDRRAQAGQRHRASQTYTLAERFEESTERYAERPCLYYGETRLTYAQTNAFINQVAHTGHQLGLRCGDVVALCMENRPGFVFVWLGLAKLGVTAVFLNTNVRGKSLEHGLTETGAKLAIVGEECLPQFAATPLPADVRCWLWPDEERPASIQERAVCALDLQALALRCDKTNPPAQWRAGLVGEKPAVYIFTSGTTGLPKAAIISHARWLITGDVMQTTMDVKPSDCFYCFLPLYHGAASLSVGATAIASGASLVLRRKFSRSEFWADVHRYQISICQYVGEIVRFLLTTPVQAGEHEHSLRKMVGAGMASEVWEQWVRRFGEFEIYEGWGATEANTNTINLDNRMGSCGRIPFWEKSNLRLVRYDPDNQCHLRDQYGYLQLCAPGEVGEAIGMIVNMPDVVGGRFEGYTSALATERKILRDVFQSGDAWWSSGDLLRYDEDGYFWFVDRIGDTYRWKSENVSTTEVADALGDFPGLYAITVYGVQVPGCEGRAGMAALVMQKGAQFDAQAFWKLALERLPAYAAPYFVRISADTDMTGNYKLRKVNLQRQAYDTGAITEPLYMRRDDHKTYVALTALDQLQGVVW